MAKKPKEEVHADAEATDPAATVAQEDRGECPKVVVIDKGADKIPVQVKDWAHYDSLVALHGDGKVIAQEASQ